MGGAGLFVTAGGAGAGATVQPARLQGLMDDVGAGEQEKEATPSVKKRKNKVQRVNKRRGAARLYALALHIDQLQSDLATGAHL